MRWRQRNHAPRPPRPKVRPLAATEREQILAEITKGIDNSPVLTAFDVRGLALRGRFYLEWQWDGPDEESKRITHGRITPLDDSSDQLVLEVERGRDQWSEITRGLPRKLINQVAGDTKGTFHGLGSLDKSLRRATKKGLDHLPVKKAGRTKFLYADSGEPCSVQEALFHYFNLPVSIIAQPRDWYAYHRTPKIVECSVDRTRVLVRFLSSSWSGESFGGTCLYLNWEGEWDAYPIRPNQSQDIATAEAWLVKRNWEPWC